MSQISKETGCKIIELITTVPLLIDWLIPEPLRSVTGRLPSDVALLLEREFEKIKPNFLKEQDVEAVSSQL